MKRPTQVAVVVVLLLVMVFGTFQLAAGGTGVPYPGPMPNVGWNSKPTGSTLGGDQPNVGWNTKATADLLPGYVQPCVGWHS